MNEPEATHAIMLDGRRYGWRAVGDGPPLLLLNGYAGSARDWDPVFLGTLARSFRVICPDHRGIGASQLGTGEAITIEALAADVIALLDALEIERAPLVGWSMGSFIAQRVVTLAPTRVSALALLSSDPGGPGAVLSDDAVWAGLTDYSDSPRAQASRVIALLFPATLAAAIDAQVGDLVAAAKGELNPAALAAQETAILAWHAADQPPPPSGSPPVLIAHGDEDVIIPAANAELLAAHWPGARVEHFPGAGHAFMAQEPERLGALITGFVNG
ncbi:alpha/beta fold hydrolase [Conexibacter sp. CPCC 206217]|uniref:alpha/beta fold hydrolase n=1 Tax=Conexibacter sp. CPCC 206217 TaxID=3064574 RepID=UPI00271C94E9|nr:alpha/beta hydrolase [Conexibacter sp. CPCC 206217]MDO8210283.1 alpha/beta hydrolase [Conexibacter sp. CPCC 206217]